VLHHIIKNRHQLSDQRRGDWLIQGAMTALQRNGTDALKQHVIELMSLMPREAQEQMSANMAGIVKGYW
jgi:hypothetical protein